MTLIERILATEHPRFVSFGQICGLLALGFLTQFPFSNSARADSPVTKQPNVVLILSDDQAWTDYGFMGHELIKTPNLDRLASQSVLFRRGYVPTALCRPSLMTIITGRYASVHGVTGNDPVGPNIKDLKANLISKIDKLDTIPELLGEAGYLSHQSGKWWEGNFSRGGFTHGMTRGFPQPGGRHGDDGLKIGRKGLLEIETFVDQAIEKDKPFFVWYAPFLPHTPHTPPARILARYKTLGLAESVAKYYAMCTWFDETCGQLVKLLEDKDIRKDTLIIYVCDNGWIQDPNSKRYAPRSKQTAYEGGVRTPIMFSWPEKFTPSDRKELCSSIDILPTIAGVTQTRLPEDLPGLNLTKQLTTGAKIDRNSLFGESFSHDIADIDNPEETLLYRWTISDEWKLLLTYDGKIGRYKKSHPRNIRGPQLFNLASDPSEQKNLADLHPDVVERLSENLSKWYALKERKIWE